MLAEVVDSPPTNFGEQNNSSSFNQFNPKLVGGKTTIAHFSIGDMIRSFDEIVGDENKKKELIAFLEKNYRGYLPLEDIIKYLENRSTKTLLPSELILILAKREIAKFGRKAIFIDGFPRDLDQISYSLFFRDLIGYREDHDVF